MKHTLIISTFPPSRCGIASYAEEQARFIEKQDNHVIRVNLLDQHKRDETFIFSTVLGIAGFFISLGRIRFDNLSLHYADRFFFPWPKDRTSGFYWKKSTLRALQSIGLACMGLIAGKRGEIIVHEISVDPRMPRSSQVYRGLALSCFGTLCFHSRAHRNAVIGFFPMIKARKTRVISHHSFLKRNFEGRRDEARAILGLRRDLSRIFLCIGFWNSSKGFEDAIDAFVAAAVPNATFYIVGSPKDDPAGMAYAEMLTSRIPKGSKIQLIRSNLSDEAFDQWLQAADTVILPYHAVSSSGVAARASLYGKQLIMRKLAPFVEEYPEGVFFTTPGELASSIR